MLVHVKTYHQGSSVTETVFPHGQSLPLAELHPHYLADGRWVCRRFKVFS